MVKDEGVAAETLSRHYVGLNGIELFNQEGCAIDITENITTIPQSVGGTGKGTRPAHILVDGIHDHADGSVAFLQSGQ